MKWLDTIAGRNGGRTTGVKPSDARSVILGCTERADWSYVFVNVFSQDCWETAG